MKKLEFLQYKSNLLIVLALTILVLGCNNSVKKNTPLFKSLPENTSGVIFKNNVRAHDSLNILDYLYFYNGGGVAMGDINNDGLPDLFFSSNQEKNKLYLNKGNLQFEDISNSAGISGNSSWNTGAIMADVNNDGWLDIYVIAVVGIHNFVGHNELYINNQNGTFSEKSAAFGLDFQNYGTTANFFDFDLDGDLDLYLLNHAVHTEESFGKSNLRLSRDDKTGDKLLRNDGDIFTDVSEVAGIYGGINGYGLGLTVSDFNKDGYPDIYVGNDFHEDDYYYLNNGDGTFTESLKQYFGHTSRFSMGNDATDINHDGWPDLLSLDMAPEDEKILKSSEGDDTFQTLQMRTKQYGYHYQFTRNMLYINNQGRPFTEIALQSGIASTDWSWSGLFGDYNLDGEQDLFVSNGISKRPNDLDFIRFVSSGEIQKKMLEDKLMDQKALELMPNGAVPNYLFLGDGEGKFNNQTHTNIPQLPTVSGATAIGDLNNDGALDIVINNLNASAEILINQNPQQGDYLKVKLKQLHKNKFAVGAKVYAFQNGVLQYKELFPNRGWQSASEPIIHFGFSTTSEKNKSLDSLKVIWPDRTYQMLYNLTLNETLEVIKNDSKPYTFTKKSTMPLFKKVEDNLGIHHTHIEDNHTDFNYQKLIPYEISDRGPALVVSDFNFDGKEDLFIGGAKYQKSTLFIQKDSSYTKLEDHHFANNHIKQDSIRESVSAHAMYSKDASKLITAIAVGGNTVSPSRNVLNNYRYSITKKEIATQDLKDDLYNTSVIKFYADTLGKDDNLPLYFEGNHSSPLDFGKIPPSQIHFKNGKTQKLDNLGMVTDAIWNDFSGDGIKDLIVVGEWMSPKFFRYEKNTFIETSLIGDEVLGLWNTIVPFDIDSDGDTDYLLGNWGLNHKFKASQSAPLKMYYSDFDDNGLTETVLAIHKNGKYYPLLGLNELSEQLVYLRKKFNTYKDFAGKTIEEVIGKKKLDEAIVFEVNTLTSGFLRNIDNTFNFEPFPAQLQTAPITAFVTYDFNGDGTDEALAAGNYFGVIPFHGRFDSFSGALISTDTKYILGNQLGLELEHKSVRHIKIIHLQNNPYLLVIYNNEAVEIYEIKK